MRHLHPARRALFASGTAPVSAVGVGIGAPFLIRHAAARFPAD